MPDTINVLFLAAEAEPFVKIGGLADVAGSLPLALRSLSHGTSRSLSLDVRLVLPFHRNIRTDNVKMCPLAEFSIRRSGENMPVQVLETETNGMPVYFVSGSPISATPSVYSSDLEQDREKYTFFSLAALEMVHHLGWAPNIIHANDWHTALSLYALRCRQSYTDLTSARSVFTLHNLPYMGGDCSNVLSSYGIKTPIDQALPVWAQTQPLPMGLWSADAIVPVSPTYAREIQTPEYGCGLDPFLKSRTDSLTGILNGLDANYWNPEKDPLLAVRFSGRNLDDRTFNKTYLQKTLEIKEDPAIPVMVMVGRIDHQKGLDITFETLRRLKDQNWQFIILGSGDPFLESEARQLQTDFPNQVRAVIRYDATLSHFLYGGGDLFLMPSRYEPCGLAQMIAMRYGCVPLVRATGGLKDTVEEDKTGFLFPDPTADSMMKAMEQALSTFSNPEKWQYYQENGMKQDFSWSKSANKYSKIYHSLVPFSKTVNQ